MGTLAASHAILHYECAHSYNAWLQWSKRGFESLRWDYKFEKNRNSIEISSMLGGGPGP